MFESGAILTVFPMGREPFPPRTKSEGSVPESYLGEMLVHTMEIKWNLHVPFEWTGCSFSTTTMIRKAGFSVEKFVLFSYENPTLTLHPPLLSAEF